MNNEWEKDFDEQFSAPEFDPPFIKHAVRSNDIKSFITSLLHSQQESLLREVERIRVDYLEEDYNHTLPLISKDEVIEKIKQ